VPRSPAWLTSLPDAIEQLEALERETLTRWDIQQLLGVSKRQAVVLAHRFGARRVGNALLLERRALVRQFQAIRRGAVFSREVDRKEKLVETLRRARIHRIRVPADSYNMRLATLPEGVVLSPGRIEVRFTGAQEAVKRLFDLAQALVNDFDAFERVVEENNDIRE